MRKCLSTFSPTRSLSLSSIDFSFFLFFSFFFLRANLALSFDDAYRDNTTRVSEQIIQVSPLVGKMFTDFARLIC